MGRSIHRLDLRNCESFNHRNSVLHTDEAMHNVSLTPIMRQFFTMYRLFASTPCKLHVILLDNLVAAVDPLIGL